MYYAELTNKEHCAIYLTWDKQNNEKYKIIIFKLKNKNDKKEKYKTKNKSKLKIKKMKKNLI